jgi:hypothetical protein
MHTSIGQADRLVYSSAAAIISGVYIKVMMHISVQVRSKSSETNSGAEYILICGWAASAVACAQFWSRHCGIRWGKAHQLVLCAVRNGELYWPLELGQNGKATCHRQPLIASILAMEKE